MVIAPDSFKGTVPAADAATAVAEGWHAVREQDEVLTIPLADGGEGTVAAVAAARPDGVLHRVDGLRGPDGRQVSASWLELDPGTPDSTAVIEMASVSGLPLMDRLDPLGATTYGLGQLINAALDSGCRTVIVGAGGSATTDGGAGALAALGLHLLDDHGRPVPYGGAELGRLAKITGRVRRPEKLIMLSDVDAPLLGPRGAAAVFGPQKGADPEQIVILDAALSRFAALLGGPTDEPGMGAAGGLGYGLVAGLGAVITPGAPYLAGLAGLPVALARADLVISGEGRFDETSLGGKVVGYVLTQAAAHQVDSMIIAGQVAHRVDGIAALSLAELSGSTQAALADPIHWLRLAGSRAAASLPVTH
ncbi:glycerate kinase [Microlunatus sp. Gsoil 973]|uniref:glycerate kinase family protein n=1 Tax=Microlunatus sp. Gsoil 973 TaxID=2672569 RepID=UPI001E5EF100|nr:glycerate kinase [Microlunatus sp. Gsoil 973]